ncbi:TPA: hypothetical protein ACTUNV_002625 [Legionella pneumophila]
MAEIYGSRFINQYGDHDSGVWARVLNDLSEADMDFGLMAMTRDIRFETWPPNCTQFRHLCLSRLNQSEQTIPTVNKAFNEAMMNLYRSKPKWSHAAVKFTVKCVGVKKIYLEREDLAFKAFKNVYQKVLAKVLEGHQVPDVADEDVILKITRNKSSAPNLSQLLRGLE